MDSAEEEFVSWTPPPTAADGESLVAWTPDNEEDIVSWTPDGDSISCNLTSEGTPSRQKKGTPKVLKSSAGARTESCMEKGKLNV